MQNLYHLARECFLIADPDEKSDKTQQIVALWQSGSLEWMDGEEPIRLTLPGHLARPVVVLPKELKRRRIGSLEGRAAMIHAMAHIELTAVNLAWETIYHYRGMPREFYDDWIIAAGEESGHFLALRDRMRELGFDYGDFPVHDELWKMALRTGDDLMHRMGIVHRVFEARALDVVPKTMKKFEQIGDRAMVSTLTMIANDEVGHVDAGTRWFRYRCAQQGLDPDTTFFKLVSQYIGEPLKGPFNNEVRLKAGFSANEIQRLNAGEL